MPLSTVLFQDIPERLSKTQRAVLEEMANEEEAERYDDAEIVCCGIECWLGSRRISWRTVRALLCCILISEDDEGKGVYRYRINGSGREVLRDESALARIRSAILRRMNFDAGGKPI